ncbi:polar amino acid transport system substrate-binding protein [Actimicrobium sp. GrIS 1.19]|uniref:substrate-binding periplasmic protein n=1 Tax=Actimicrobium sp. GrIS 1.19 TaxID=3071708 RepID=UPI002DFB2476|nr:polar amino acid transport system substrate-binding protein [Actimicrobium sp. GrIS 1.19]
MHRFAVARFTLLPVVSRFRGAWRQGAPAALALALALTSQCASAGACEKTVRWNDDPPYSWRDENGAINGFYVELVRNALQRMGCTARFVELPWARALVDLEAGNLDILPGALHNPQRDAFALFSHPVNRSPNVLFVARAGQQRFPLKTLADIIGTEFVLGAQIKVSYGPQFDALLADPEFNKHLYPIGQRRSGWKMLQVGRIDGLIADEVTGLIELKQLNLQETVVKSRVVVSGEPALIAFSRRAIDERFVERFDAALDTLRADGEYVRIRERNIPCRASSQTLACS